MDELDFIEALTKESSDKGAKKVLSAFRSALEWAKNNKKLLGHIGVGSAIGGTSAYLTNKPDKKTGKSVSQKAFSKHEKAYDGEPPHKAATRIFKNVNKDVADYGAKHPKTMAAIGTVMGGMSGRSLHNKIGPEGYKKALSKALSAGKKKKK